MLIAYTGEQPYQERRLKRHTGRGCVLQGELLNTVASKTVKVLVVGNPANTNALIAAECAPNVPKGEFQNMPAYAYKSAGDVV